MMKPRYMLCCEERVVDQETGLVTYYNVTDQLSVISSTTDVRTVVPLPLPKLVVSAVWARDIETEDRDELCQHEMRMLVPGEETPRVLHTGEFQFGECRYYRFDLVLQPQPKPSGDVPASTICLRPGILRLESRVRREVDTAWLSQEYEIPIVFLSGSKNIPVSSS
jgi:hypothetical protein